MTSLGTTLLLRTYDRTSAAVLPVAPRPGLAGAAVRGHHTARWLPTAPGDAPRGYRDAGSVTLAATARVTAGLPLPPVSDGADPAGSVTPA